ncbi:MAG: glycosyltransferase family 2 protein [Epsilonproteobacteria bacterium]|nr:MAG: glycosyltransferase family 2 protein [Campylobacterota bacterium]
MAITIGIPFYNAEAYLADAIRSVFAQTYQDWELILIDDGSTDNSLAIARSVDDPRVRVYSDGKNKKLASRLNELTQLATCEFIARMDADDMISPRRLEKQMKIFEKFPEKDLVSTGVFSITNDKELIGSRGDNATNVLLEDLLYKRVGIVHAAILARKSWYQRNQYDTSLKIAQDYDLWLRSSKKDDLNIFLISEPLYYYREEGNATSKKLLSAYKNERRMYIKYAGDYPIRLLVKSYVKTFVVKSLSLVGKLDILLNNRSTSQIDSERLELFTKELDIIKKTKVPGLDI